MNTSESTVEIPVNGIRMAAFLSRPTDRSPFPAVIVIQEAFGLNNHIKNVAKRFAAEGHVGLAPDFYARQGGKVVHYSDIDAAIKLMNGVKDDLFLKDFEAAMGFLKGKDFVRADRIGVVGFCMGGSLSFLAATSNRDVKAAVVFYGGRIGNLIDKIPGIKCPILGNFGETDTSPSPDIVNKVSKELSKHGKTHDFKIYPKSGHGFFCEERASYNADSAKDAWQRTLNFYKIHLKK